MSKEEFLKIQTCILKVNIHCEGCKGKVKKILQKIEGVYKINIDSEQGKVTVSGNVEPETLIKKLGKSGKHAELWGPPQKQNQQQLNNQPKNLQIENNNGKGGNNKGQKGKSDNQQQQQPKTGGAGKQGQQNPNQLQQMKAPQDLKMAQFKDNPKMPFGKGAAKLKLPEEDDITDDEFEDDDDEFDDDDEDESEDDDMDGSPHLPLNKMKPVTGNGQMPTKMKSGQMQPQNVNMSHAKDANGAKSNNNGGGSAKKGVGNGNVPVQVNGGKKVGGGNGNNTPNQSSGGGGKSGGSPTSGGKSGNGGNSGGPPNKNGKNAPAGNVGGSGDNFSTNNNGIGGVKKGGSGMNDGVRGLPKASNVFPGNAGHTGAMPMMGQMGGNPMGQMGAVQGLPASAIQAGASGYFRPEGMTGNPFYQQQLAAAGMMNQPVNANEGFHPMMYARPPPAVSYMPPPYPYPYPYPYPPPANHYTSSFSDENPSSCSLM